jgi:PTH1 family peptidyl-tRNA hydrolase
MKKLVLFGLGNPGDQFSHTRHNLGMDMVQAWVDDVKDRGVEVSERKTHESFHARMCEVKIGDATITVLAPLVFMNESGKVLVSYLRYHPIEREHILVVHDELELSLGEIQLQKEGSAHGHNGVRSLHEYLGDMNIPRLRIGIGRPQDATAIDKFVLSTFTAEEKTVLATQKPNIVDAISEALQI